MEFFRVVDGNLGLLSGLVAIYISAATLLNHSSKQPLPTGSKD